MGKALFKFYLDYEGEEVESVFIEDEEKVNSVIGKEAYFAYGLSKYLEDVYVELEQGMFTKVDLDLKSVKKIEKTLGKEICGYHPFERMELHCEQEDCWTHQLLKKLTFVDGAFYCKKHKPTQSKN